MSTAVEPYRALSRFGLGPRPGEAQALSDPRAWLMNQLVGKSSAEATAFAGLPSSLDYLHREADYLQERARAKAKKNTTVDDSNVESPSPQAKPANKLGFRKVFGDDLLTEFRARYVWASTTPAGFRERLTHFWSNHFAVSLDKRQSTLYAAPMEREAIRPRVCGKFEDLLLAVTQHPAMLRYLDNVVSIGADSAAAENFGRRQKKGNKQPGLNENLAREILELHTLGVNGGYTQTDVTEFARALTGWSMPRPRQMARENPTSAFVFYEKAHEPGARTVLGKHYAQGGEDQARAILQDLARHPATAKHLATKLARQFVADQPSPVLVDRLAKTYMDHQGDLAAVYRALIDSPEAWSGANRKLRTPDDWLIAALRAGSVDITSNFKPAMDLLSKMGQPVLTPRSPAGFADLAEDWNGPDALFKRVQAAQVLADWIPRNREPLLLAQNALGPALDADTRIGLSRAESPQQAYALLLASPAFQWR